MGENKTFIDDHILLIENVDNNYILTGIKDKKVKEVIIPNCVTEVKEGALLGCSSLEKIVLPFIGDKRHSASDSEQYPFGFIFGKVKYPLALGKKQLVKQLEKEVLYYIPFKLKEVVITDSDFIPFGAFYNCMNLKTVIMPKEVKRIEDKAFYYCNNLDEIVLPDSLTSIGEYAFYNCSNITKLRLPKDLEEIGQYAFYNCTKLTDAILENENTKIGTLAFEKTQCALKNYYKPKTIYTPNIDSITENKRRVIEAIIDEKKEDKKEIEDVPFDATLYSCVNYQNTLILSLNDDKKSKDKLKELDGVLKCPSYYGYDNKPIKGISIFLEAVNMARYITKVILPKECEVIKESCFSGCKNLTEIIFNDKLKVLEDKCFEDCLNLPEKIVFPESLEIIGHRLFKYHDKLPKVMEIHLGKNIKECASDAFFPRVRKYYDGTIEEAFKIDFDDLDKLYNFSKELYVKDNGCYVNAIDKINELVTVDTSIEQKVIKFYKENNSEKFDVSKADIVIDDSIVPSGIYNNNKLLKKVRFTSNVRKINAHAFENCINLEKVTFENGLKEIGAFAFSNTNIDSVVLPNSLERIGTKDGYENGKYTDLTSFVSNKPFKKVSFPPYGEYMAEAFNEYAYNCEVDLPIFELNTYSNSKFSKLHLKEIFIRKGTLKIPDNFIKDDPYIEIVHIPSSVYDISRHAFVNCKNLKEIIFERKDKEYNPIDYCIDCPLIEEKNVVRRDKVICKDGYILCKKVYDENSFDEFKKLILIFNNYFAWDGHNRVDDKFENIKNYEDFINVAISKTKATTFSFARKYNEQKEVSLRCQKSYDVYLSKVYYGKKEKNNFLVSDDFALDLSYARYSLTITKTKMLERRYYHIDYFMENENLEGIIYFMYKGDCYCIELDYEPWD